MSLFAATMCARTRMPYRPDSTANFPQAAECLASRSTRSPQPADANLAACGLDPIRSAYLSYNRDRRQSCYHCCRLLLRTIIDANDSPSPGARSRAQALQVAGERRRSRLASKPSANTSGRSCVILGHHYQQDEVIALSDLRGDSYGLSQHAADSSDCRYIVFCGVHFMAETADILANRPEKLAERDGVRIPVMLPDLAAGCSMADMAGIHQIEDAWDQLGEVIDTNDITPVTYINSAASLKAFVGRHGGIVCTSSNAEAALRWSFERTSRVMFFPDQHLGRNTALGMGITLDEMPLWDPHADSLGGSTEEQCSRAK